MEATTIIIAAALALQVNVLFSGNDLNSAPVASAKSTITLTSLAPTVPVEATFEDVVVLNDFAYLAPTTPAEAQFEDISYESVAALNLAPITTICANFEDGIDFSSLAPVVPAVTTFE